MKYKIFSCIIIFSTFGSVSAQPGGQDSGQPMPAFMQKFIICKSDPDNEICQDKKNNSIKKGESTPSEDVMGKFSLKGLNLKMKKQEVLSILPKAKAVKTDNFEGKDVESYLCGKHVADAKSVCNFTFGGVEILDVVVDFWGDDVVQIKLYFNDYRQPEKNNFTELRKNIQDGLDVKYKEYANPAPRLGNRDPGDGVWTNKSEVLKFDLSRIHSDKLETLVLVNTTLRKKIGSAASNKQQNDEEMKNKQRVNKSTSDM